MEELLVYSNLAFLFPAVRAGFTQLDVFRAVVYALVPFTSGTYHACRAGGTCLFPYEVHHAADFVVAQLAIPLSALFLIHWKQYKWVERLLIFAFLIGMIFAVVQGGDTPVAQGIIAALSLGIVFLYWIGYGIATYMDTGRCGFPRYDWGALLLGVMLTGQAIGLFQVQNQMPMSWYWIIHSAWHVQAAFGQWYILAVKAPPAQPMYVTHGRTLTRPSKKNNTSSYGPMTTMAARISYVIPPSASMPLILKTARGADIV